MQTCVTVEMEEAVRFQRGNKLPSTGDLIDKLNQLHEAQNQGKLNLAWNLENDIRMMVKRGIYEGYLDDDLRISVVRFLSVRRMGSGANRHTFYVLLQKLDGTSVVGVHKMDLMDFLSEVNRERLTGSQHIGPRFWPF
jgi:hypothetical protein